MNRLLQPEIMVIFLCLFSLGLPLSVFTIRELVKDKRYQIGTKLVDDFPNLKLAHSYIFAMAKYGKNVPEHATSNVKRLSIWVKNLGLPGYSVPIGTYVLISFTGFYCTIALTVDSSETKYPFGNYLLYGMYAGVDIVVPKGVDIVGPKQSTSGNETITTSPPGTNDKLPPEVRSSASRRTYTVDEIRQYERGTMAVLVAAFLGSYLWTLIYLARRVTNFDLSPFSFLRATIQISLACFVSIFFRHLYDALPQMLWNTSSSSGTSIPETSSWLLALAFLIGFYPALGLNYLQERFAFLRFKSRNANADLLAREMPLEMIDGIDSYIKFRLGEYEIEDIQNLALANPIQLFIETPYPMLKIVDWIGQAQLILEIETGKIPDLRNLSIRTSLDLISFGEEDSGKKVLRGILHPLQEDNTNNPIIPRLLSFGKKPHVKRLIEIHDILSKEPKVGDTVADTPIGLAA